MASYPFVEWDNFLVTGINTDPILAFGDQDHTCFMDSVIICNLVENVTKVTAYLLDEDGKNIPIINGRSISRLDSINIWPITSTIKPTQLLYIHTDLSENLITAYCSFRRLKELPMGV